MIVPDHSCIGTCFASPEELGYGNRMNMDEIRWNSYISYVKLSCFQFFGLRTIKLAHGHSAIFMTFGLAWPGFVIGWSLQRRPHPAEGNLCQLALTATGNVFIILMMLQHVAICCNHQDVPVMNPCLCHLQWSGAFPPQPHCASVSDSDSFLANVFRGQKRKSDWQSPHSFLHRTLDLSRLCAQFATHKWNSTTKQSTFRDVWS